MKILYVDYYYHYGNNKNGINNIGVDGFAKAFKELGHVVYNFHLDKHLDNLEQMNTALLDYFNVISPDLVFFNLYHKKVNVKTIMKMTEKSTTVNWFGDDPFIFENFTKLYAPYFTICITTDKFSMHKYKEIGQNNVIYSQWPAFETTHIDLDVKKYNYEVSFVGDKNPPRAWFINELLKRGIKVSTFGTGWESGRVDNDEMLKIFLNSKINLNLSNSDTWDLKFLLSPYISKFFLIAILFRRIIKTMLKLINKKIKIHQITFTGKYSSQIKARNFEIPVSGGFQLSHYVPTLEDYFYIGKELACFNTIDEAEKQIKYYLRDDTEREKIKIAGYNKAVNEFTYKIVVSRVLKEITSIKK